MATTDQGVVDGAVDPAGEPGAVPSPPPRRRRERAPGGFRAYGFVPDREREYTADEVRALNAANPRYWPRFECVGGRLLVTPAPGHGHQKVVERLFLALGLYCREHFPDGVAKLSPADISWGGSEHTVQPDVYVVPREEERAAMRQPDEPAAVAWREIRHLLLAVEVWSPGTAGNDRGPKRELYQRQRVPLYWIVDGRGQVVEEWTPDAAEARVERGRLVWRPEGAAVPFELALATLFAPE